MPNVTPARRGLEGFNALSPIEAERELLACCASGTFARQVAASRPYDDIAPAVDTAEAAVKDLSWPEVLEALTAHPRIGERMQGSGRESLWSRLEQSGVTGSSYETRGELLRGNMMYEERFGHVYLICATGLSAEEMLGRLRDRLRNDQETERAVVREELAKITRLRVAKLLAEGGNRGEEGA
ncbi:2-oxo-4-hydroxy-4-carboxy-5-ureidoimidazoline decarboxylase [Sphaerisporangium sp. NBC_01403]|uniref:2-oxo-4-hydroxy-4-carboxy-5-ureidoimidazoline decarboxylase n=1 Tax=Sphaerisporangium sp. NBC_01403 TaxID=2903599 RepID=UPI00324C375B